jgi:5-methylcytosine-specific restriction endonuclease McrA
VLKLLGLRPTGGNYKQVQKYIKEAGLSTEHFTGKLWNKGEHVVCNKVIPLENILVVGSNYQTYRLRNRLFKAGLKPMHCEECGWAEVSGDGRIPLELDHINGDHNDNRLENLRILCPNCHSLKPTYRGCNKGRYC